MKQPDVGAIGSTIPISPFATVDDVVILLPQKPIRTKSGGDLYVLLMETFPSLTESFFRYDQREIAMLPVDTRGLRCFTVRGLEPGRIGGQEFHRLQTEYIFVLHGAVDLECEDLAGSVRALHVNEGGGVLMPPLVLHTYTVIESAELLVVTSTLLFTEQPVTCDAYSEAMFRQLQAKARVGRKPRRGVPPNE